MDEYTEGIFVFAVYLFVVVAFSLPPLVIYFIIRIRRIIKRADNILSYVEENEKEANKFH